MINKNLIYFITPLLICGWLEIKAQEWVEAGYLKSGNILTTSQGESSIITKVEVIPSVQTVYNIEVEDWHAYYVGNSKTLTHNQ